MRGVAAAVESCHGGPMQVSAWVAVGAAAAASATPAPGAAQAPPRGLAPSLPVARTVDLGAGLGPGTSPSQLGSGQVVINIRFGWQRVRRSGDIPLRVGALVSCVRCRTRSQAGPCAA